MPLRTVQGFRPRRLPMALAGALVLAAAAWALPAALRPAPLRPRPTSLLIVLDTTRADRGSVIGHDRETTPGLAAFAADATVYTQAWSPAGWTAPAHASLFTGLRPERHGLWMGHRLFLDEAHTTLAERLAAAGYRTACFTANPVVSGEFGLIQGFEHVEGLHGTHAPRPPVAHRAHERLLKWTAGAGGPWFAFVNHMEPHLPYTPPAQHTARFLRPGTPAEVVTAMRAFGHPVTLAVCAGSRVLDAVERAALSDLYDAEIAGLDAQLTHLFDRLAARGDLDDTVVAVVGDHGENLGERGLVGHQFSLHRSVLHVPLIVRYPGVVAEGARGDALVRLGDAPPTLLGLAGVGVPRDLDGVSLLRGVVGRVARAIQGPVADGTAHQLRVAGAGRDVRHLLPGQRSVFDGRHHLIQHADGRLELYDLEADPAETRNLARSHEGVARRLAASLPRYD